MPHKIWVNESRRIMICVDSYENGVLKGWFCDGFQQVQQFFSLSQFLLKLEQLLDEIQQPQSYTKLRRYPIPLQEMAETWSPTATGKVQATFDLNVIFRQHSSWQGTLLWREGGIQHSFRSVLELVTLIDSALRSEEGSVAV